MSTTGPVPSLLDAAMIQQADADAEPGDMDALLAALDAMRAQLNAVTLLVMRLGRRDNEARQRAPDLSVPARHDELPKRFMSRSTASADAPSD